MILADKIIGLRKKNGWSQEELADKMNISRQAVSKWESAQTLPDLEKILQLSALFGVTTDYLLKDEIEDEDFTGYSFNNHQTRKSVAKGVLVAYFGILTMIYLVWSILSKEWHVTWLIYVGGGAFVPLIKAFCDAIVYKK